MYIGDISIFKGLMGGIVKERLRNTGLDFEVCTSWRVKKNSSGSKWQLHGICWENVYNSLKYSRGTPFILKILHYIQTKKKFLIHYSVIQIGAFTT